jgi:hypothetical protein
MNFLTNARISRMVFYKGCMALNIRVSTVSSGIRCSCLLFTDDQRLRQAPGACVSGLAGGSTNETDKDLSSLQPVKRRVPPNSLHAVLGSTL